MGACAGLAACGAGTLTQAVRPEAQTAAQAQGEAASCSAVSREGKPLVVDWKPEQRMDLEVAMQAGVAVVAYDCKRLELLSDCHADGSYGFKGVVLKQQVIRLADSDEIRLNLPLSGASLAAKISGELERGATLDLATALVGNQTSTRMTVTRADLKGRCDGATHFVRGANVGAFVMETGEKANAKAAADIFMASAAAGSGSSKLARQEDGRLDACQKGTAEGDKPPQNCGAIVRLHLVGISDTPAPAAPAKANAKFVGVAEEEDACPAGMVISEGKCTKPSAAADRHVCRRGDVPDCTAQCDKGEATSCARAASAYLSGTGVGEDAGKAAALYKKSCDLGYARGCSNYGALLSKGTGVAKDDGAAARSFEKACGGGEAVGCFNLAAMTFEGRGVPKDASRATALFKQACDAGSAAGCVNLGAAYDDGAGVPKDPAKALALFKRACEGDQAEGCTNLGVMYSSGSNADPKAAASAYLRGCTAGSATSCERMGKRYQEGNGVDKDEAKGAEMLRRSCELGNKAACK